MSKATVARITIATSQSETVDHLEIDLEAWKDPLSRSIVWMEVEEAVERAIERSKEELENV